MKASRFTDAQKAFVVKQGEEGKAVAEICRQAGISQATYFNWKKKYAGLLPSEMRRLRELESLPSGLTRGTRTVGSRRSSPICRWTRRCCRTSSNESSEACPDEDAGRRDTRRLEGVDPPGLSGPAVRYVQPPLQVPSARAGRS